MKADKGAAAIGSLGGDDALVGFFSWRQRFFESDRQAALEASDGVLSMEVVGRADDDAVEVGLSAQQVAEVVLFRNALIKVSAGRSVATVRWGVGETDDFHVVALPIGLACRRRGRRCRWR